MLEVSGAELVAAVFSAITFACALIVIVQARGARRAAAAASAACARQNAYVSEFNRFYLTRESLARTSSAATTAVGVTTGATRTAHDAIAGSTYDVLASMPRVAERSEAVREVHEVVGNLVFGALELINQAVGDKMQGRLMGGSSRATEAAIEAAETTAATGELDQNPA